MRTQKNFGTSLKKDKEKTKFNQPSSIPFNILFNGTYLERVGNILRLWIQITETLIYFRVDKVLYKSNI